MLPPINSYNSFLYLYVLILHRPVDALFFSSSNHAHQKRQAPTTTPLVDFQVSQPVLTPSGTSDEFGCIHTQTLMSHVFANSYGVPFVGKPFRLSQISMM